MKYKKIIFIGLLIGMLSFSSFIYISEANLIIDVDDGITFETDTNVVTRRNLILNFLRLNFWVTGLRGFSSGLGGNVELSQTYHGVAATTYIFGHFAGLSLDFFFGPMIDSISSKYNRTLYAYGAKDKNTVDLYSTYYAVRALELVGASTDSRIALYVNSLQNSDGGFGSRENETSTLSSTYCATYLLRKYGRLDLLDNATDWIVQTKNLDVGSENYGAFSSNKSDPTYTIYSTYEALSSRQYPID